MLLLTKAVRLLENIPQMHRFCIGDILSIECKQALWLGRHSLNASESVNIISNFEFQAYFSISLVHLLIFSLSEAWRWVMCLAMPTSCPQISKSSASFALSIFSISLFHFFRIFWMVQVWICNFQHLQHQRNYLTFGTEPRNSSALGKPKPSLK